MKFYQDKTIVLLTKHKKESVIRPLIESETGASLVVLDDYDTDKLGTFSREIKRAKSQLTTVRNKVKIGMKLAKAEIGIASEGSFGQHPYAPIPWNVEMVLLYDKENDLELVGIHESSETNFGHITVENFDQVVKFADQIGFPSHYLILRPDNDKAKYIVKDVFDYMRLKESYDLCLKMSRTGKVFVETDMRAHANPTRMNNIENATKDLLLKLFSRCPKCDMPGFIIKERVQGLPCMCCGEPSELTLKFIYRCQRCKHEKEELYPQGKYAPPEYCEYCNP